MARKWRYAGEARDWTNSSCVGHKSKGMSVWEVKRRAMVHEKRNTRRMKSRSAVLYAVRSGHRCCMKILKDSPRSNTVQICHHNQRK